MRPAVSDRSSTPLPCVVQVGFAGSRRLYESPPAPDLEVDWNDLLRKHLTSACGDLREKLVLKPHHFLCGISQIACGADMIFTRACQSSPQPMLQRIFLPQPLDDYLDASGGKGPDFTEEQKAEVRALLASPHVVQERVVSQSQDRYVQFRETNAEIARVSDAVICLLREDAADKAGGTNELLQRAKAIGIPALEIRVGFDESGHVFCRNLWHPAPTEKPGEIPEPPSIPEPLHELSLPAAESELPAITDYCGPLKLLVSSQAKTKQRLFKYAAALIIDAHILATLCATVALALHGHGGHAASSVAVATSDSAEDAQRSGRIEGRDPEQSRQESPSHDGGEQVAFGEHLIPWLLGSELLLLAAGFGIHQYLHRSEAARIWANARVVAELARSVQAIYPRHLYLEHLFRLSLPHRFRPLLRTLSALHLRSTRNRQDKPWEAHRSQYLEKRIVNQIRFYKSGLSGDRPRLKLFRSVFMIFSGLAMATTVAKLGLLQSAAIRGHEVGGWPQLLGSLAIVCPVLAVAGLSWLAALDCEARVETFEETLDFLHRQQKIIAIADTAEEFDRLVIETETVLLGEVANWFCRRANTGVT